MATTPIDHVHGAHVGAVYFSEEGAFCTVGTERRAYPVVDTVEVSPTVTTVERRELSSVPFDVQTPVTGNKGGTVKFDMYLEPPVTLLDELGTLPTDATMPERVPLRVLFGGESIPDVGTQAATPTSATAITVDSGDGANFPAGQLCAVYTNGASGLEVAQVRSRSTDDLTLYPALSATPGSNADVVQFVTYYPSWANSRSMSVALTSRNADRQYRMLGCTGTMQLKLENNALAVASFELQAATYEGPDTLSLAYTRGESGQTPLSVRNSIVLLQSTATTTRVNTAVDKCAITLNFGMEHLTSLTGTTEGKRATHRGQNLVESFAKIELEMPDNADVYTWHAAGTELSFWFIVRAGTAAARRHVVVHCPQCVIESVPTPMKGEGNLTKLKVVLRAKLSEQCTGTLDNEELARSPFLLGLG